MLIDVLCVLHKRTALRYNCPRPATSSTFACAGWSLSGVFKHLNEVGPDQIDQPARVRVSHYANTRMPSPFCCFSYQGALTSCSRPREAPICIQHPVAVAHRPVTTRRREIVLRSSRQYPHQTSTRPESTTTTNHGIIYLADNLPPTLVDALSTNQANRRIVSCSPADPAKCRQTVPTIAHLSHTHTQTYTRNTHSQRALHDTR